jgi:nucleotide sugar dehydrogenase
MPEYCDTLHEKMSSYNYVVSYNPEFIAQGTILRDQANPDMVLIGEGDKEAGDIIQEHYDRMTNNHPRVCRMNRIEAEITKLSLNCFLTTKIAYANMVGDIAIKSGADPDVVLGAIGHDTRIGNKYLRYGYGYGGPCFPRDNRALAIYAGDKGIDAIISRASDRSNNMHLMNQVKFFLDINPEPTTIMIDTVTYKPESTMIVESQQLAYAATLVKHGHKVIINERPSVVEQVKLEYGDLFEYQTREP